MTEQGPFDRILQPSGAKDKTARAILIGLGALGSVLLLLVLIPGSPLRSKGTVAPKPGVTQNAASSARLPKVPEGYEALSNLFSLEKPKGTEPPYSLSVNLVQPVTNSQNLGIYTNRNGKWERVASATLINNGAAARGDVQEMPTNVAVLRRTATAAQVSGSLPAGAQVDPASLDVVASISPQDYTPNPDGSLAGAPTVVNAPGKAIVPAVKATQPKEIDAVGTVLSTPDLRDAHVNALVALAGQPGNSGIELQYEGLAPPRKADLNALIASLSDKLHGQGKTLTLTLPAPVRAGVAWDTGAYDWEELSKRADAIKLFPERDPSLFYKRTQEIADFLRPKIDLKKVMLVVSRQSVEKGSDGLTQMPLTQALATASAIEVRTTAPVAPNSSVSIVGKNIFQDDGATGLQWDTNAFAVSFSYPGRGGTRTVWLENSLSLAFRLDLAKRLGFGSIAVDDVSLNPDAPAFWDPLRAFAESGTVPLAQPNGILLRPLWQTQAGSIDAGQGVQKGNVVWKAPAQPGTYDVSLVVSDGVIRASQKVVLEVRPPSAASPTPRPTTTATATPRP
jgi:hypothetical protein